ncbi:hypothetical protein BGZ82_002710 [Podila clonocystis]|nr:hypothetical protein BGZ82_002710 [Podila clonocystis]
MTTTASPIALAELTKVRSSGHQDYPDRAEPRSLALELAPAPNSTSSSSYSTRHHHGNYSDYDQFGNNGNNGNGNGNNGISNGHHSHHSSTSSSSSYHPQSSSYLPPPIQTSSYNNANSSTHSFTSPSSPLSPITYPPSTSGHYDYDHPQGQYYPPYQSNHSSYPQEHHHPLSPATEGSGHYFYGSQPIPTGKAETGGNGSYSSSSSSSHYPRD